MSKPGPQALLVSALVSAFLGMSSVAAAQDMQRCIASNEKSIALRKAGKLRDALEELRTCAADRCVADIQTVCEQRIAEIHAAMPTIVFGAKDGSGHDLIAVKVGVDTKPLAERLDGAAIAVDPGAHDFSFEVAGRPVLMTRLLIREGEKDRHETVVIEGAPARPGSEAESGGTGATLGLVVGGAGAAALIAGGVLGLWASSKWSDSKSECGAPGCSPAAHAAAIADHDSASGMALGSTIAFVAGGSALAAGAVLFLVALPGRHQTAAGGKVQITPGLGGQCAGAIVKGAF
jgi:hypothetical protein